MGAWGTGPFGNDDAADFADDVWDEGDTDRILAHLADALTAVTDAEGYVEAPEMNRALAAAVLVALFAETTLPTPPEVDQSWLDSIRAAPTDQLRNLAAQTFRRALEPENNEWYELWAEADLVEEVRDHLTPYSSALT